MSWGYVEVVFVRNCLVLALVVMSWPVSATESLYRVSWSNDWPYLSGAFALHVAGWVGAHNKSSHNDSEVVPQNSSKIPAFEKNVAGNWDVGAQHQSNVVVTVAVVAPTLLFAQSQTPVGDVAAMYAETLLITSGGVTTAKNWVDRSRPFTYGNEAPESAKANIDSKRSFFSGHTAHTAAALVFGATVFEDINPGSEWVPWYWSGAVSLTAYEAYLRVHAGKHFPSDTLVGAAWGGWVGYSVPAWHRRDSTRAAIAPVWMGDTPGVGVWMRL